MVRRSARGRLCRGSQRAYAGGSTRPSSAYSCRHCRLDRRTHTLPPRFSPCVSPCVEGERFTRYPLREHAIADASRAMEQRVEDYGYRSGAGKASASGLSSVEPRPRTRNEKRDTRGMSLSGGLAVGITRGLARLKRTTHDITASLSSPAARVARSASSPTHDADPPPAPGTCSRLPQTPPCRTPRTWPVGRR